MLVSNIRRLKVAYNPNVMPFSYFNDKGPLVGCSIAWAYKLAQERKVKNDFNQYFFFFSFFDTMQTSSVSKFLAFRLDKASKALFIF